MHCMEVLGGNQGIEESYQAVGLDIWVYSRPHGEAVAGGDVHYLSSCASGRVTRMLLADVSGHGEPVSELAAGLRDLMRRNINYIKQNRFVRAMNQQFTASAERGCFATAIVSTFYAPTRTLTLCSAGHHAPLIFLGSASRWSELEHEAEKSLLVKDIPLGIMGDVSYSQQAMRLQADDMVLCYSDAIIESTDEHGRQLGQAGILKLVRELDVQAPEQLIPALVERLTSLAGNNLRQDDATLLLYRVTGGGPSLKNNLLAPFRMFGTAVDRTSLD